MKKNRIMGLLGIVIPVFIAALGEYSDIKESRETEAKMEEMENRIALLEKKDSE